MKKIDGMKLYDVEDLVKMLKLSRATLQAYLRAGRIKGVKIGKRWHVTDINLKDFLSGAGRIKKRGPGPRRMVR